MKTKILPNLCAVAASCGIAFVSVAAAATTLTVGTATDFVLQQTDGIATANWSNVTNPVSVAGNNHQVTISPLTGSWFFRLFHP